MAESLERSRRKWVSEGIFEKFWTKPPKRRAKDPPSQEELRNPPKECMTKIGQCTITIEPHAFDAIMYTVKDTTPKAPLPPPPQPLYRPIIQYGPPNGIIPQHPPHQSPQMHNQYAPMQMVPQPPSVNGTPQKPPQSPAGPYGKSPVNGQATPQSYPPPSTPHQSPVPSPAPAAKSSDPVIQMLAERAATDPDLKALMRIVADGKATTDELKKFQAHIDELTEILKQREREASAAQQARLKAQQGSAMVQSPKTQGHGLQMANKPTLQAPGPATGARQPLPSPQQQRQYQAPNIPSYPAPPPQPQALRSKGPVAPKPDISAVVFEFVGGNGDRYLFPKYSILEYLPGGQVIASFLIVRKGSAADARCYDPSLDYYQPVTIRLWTNGSGKQLESLAKVVKPPEEVRRYMDDVMDNMTRAEYVLLAMRLPRDKGENSGGTGNDSENSKEKDKEKEDDARRKSESEKPPAQGVLWNTSAYEVNKPMKKKKVERLLTEEEKYQGFIRSVSEHT